MSCRASTPAFGWAARRAGDAADPRLRNLGYWCVDAVAATPDKVALIDLAQPTPREVTYAMLEERLNRVASRLLALGLEPGDRLLLSASNRAEYLDVMFGAMRAGVVPVPLSTKLGADAIAHILVDSGATAAVVEDAANATVRDLVDQMELAVRIAFGGGGGWLDLEDEIAAGTPIFAPISLAPDHPCFLPYTSGSTGRPKGVVLPHEGQCWWLRCVLTYWPTSPEARVLAAVPLYHKNAMAGAIKPVLAQGGSVVLLPGFEPRRFLETLSGSRCTKAGAVPAVYALLLQERDLIRSLDFSELKLLTVGSAPTPKELQDAIEAAFGVPVVETYGLTEGGPVMIGPPVDGRRVPHGSCGVAWPEGEVKLVGADGMESASDGELWVRNPGVTPGYYNLPKVNAARFVDGWLRTGDVFHRDHEGFFYFRGRTDDMFNSGGENIYPIEVEDLLLRHPSVAEVSVVPLPHRIKGEAPVAMVVVAKGMHVDEDELKRFCLAHGPAYAHPRRIHFVTEMPLNGPGKIDRRIVQRIMSETYGVLG